MPRLAYITEANKRVKVSSVLSSLFGIDADDGVDGQRTSCPQGYDHSDGGVASSLRVYPTDNTAYCFSHAKKYDVVDLAVMYFDTPRRRAAQLLLEKFEIDITPPTVEERNAALDRLEAGEIPGRLDKTSLKTAVVTYARTLPGWTSNQYIDEVLDCTNKVLQGVEGLPENSTMESLEQYLEKAKSVFIRLWDSLGLTSQSET